MVGVTRADLQRLVGSWLAAGRSPSKIRSIINAARVLWRDLDLITGHDDELLIDPTRGLRLPASTGQREWATLHRGELEANWGRAKDGDAPEPIDPLP